MVSSYEEALEIARRAQQAYQAVETKAEVEDIFLRYGKNGIGYRALCRVLFSKMAPETAVRSFRPAGPGGSDSS